MARIVPLPTGLSEKDRRWIDLRIHWLLDQYGEKLATSARIARPDNPAFQSEFGEATDPKPLSNRPPKGISSSKWEDEQVLLVEGAVEEIAEHLGVRKNHYALRVKRGRTELGEASYEDDPKIDVPLDDLDNVLALVGKASGDLAGLRLEEHDASTKAERDLPLLKELFACLSGMGVCLGNTWESDQRSQGAWHSAMTSPMIAYALAVFAWLRDEDRPKWERLLEPEIRATFGQAQTFLAEHGMHDKPDRYDAKFFNSYGKASGSSSFVAEEASTKQRKARAVYDSEDSYQEEDEYETEDDYGTSSHEAGYRRDRSDSGYANEYEDEEHYEESEYEEVDEDEYEEDGDESEDNRQSRLHGAAFVGGGRTRTNENEYVEESRITPRMSPARCVHCGANAVASDGICDNCQASNRPRSRAGQDIELPEMTNWVWQFFLIVVAIAVVLYTVSSIGGE